MKYYKILRSDMTHHEFVYKEGLNIDTEPFDETPDCGDGLFFSDAENILSFVDHGDLIAEVEVPNGTKIVQVNDKYKAHAIVLKNIKPLWNIDTLEYLIQTGIDIHVNANYAFGYAAGSGYLDVVKYFVSKGVDIHSNNEFALQLAARNGHLEIIKYLINKGANIHSDNDYAFRHASENGYIEVVQYLVSNGANIHAANNYAFRYGTPKVVAYLNSISDK